MRRTSLRLVLLKSSYVINRSVYTVFVALFLRVIVFLATNMDRRLRIEEFHALQCSVVVAHASKTTWFRAHSRDVIEVELFWLHCVDKVLFTHSYFAWASRWVWFRFRLVSELMHCFFDRHQVVFSRPVPWLRLSSLWFIVVIRQMFGRRLVTC